MWINIGLYIQVKGYISCKRVNLLAKATGGLEIPGSKTTASFKEFETAGHLLCQCRYEMLA
jgi:hypothetical protein